MGRFLFFVACVVLVFASILAISPELVMPMCDNAYNSGCSHE